MKQYALISFALLLASCITQQQVYNAKKLESGEGILLAQFTCGDLVNSASIYKTGTGWSKHTGIWNRDAVLRCSNNYNILKLPEGDYYISHFVGMALEREENALKFSIVRNKINYIGHINLNVRSQGVKQSPGHKTYNYNYNPTVSNQRNLAQTYLENELPELASKYDFSVSIAHK
ncbi:MAG: hypothetical protein COA45_12350 [Zetaproteobacteria bacterium]|nr:MAG: hypothetical protein COA45_12350 [Zetaproteobacteria bacterium]